MSGEGQLQQSLQALIGQINKEQTSEFWQEITDAVDPNYNKIIKHQMQLCHIEAKVLRGEYITVDQFISDLQLMYENTKLYFKDRNPHLVRLAEEILHFCQSAIYPHPQADPHSDAEIKRVKVKMGDESMGEGYAPVDGESTPVTPGDSKKRPLEMDTPLSLDDEHTPKRFDEHSEPLDEATQALRADLHRKRHHIVEHQRRMRMRALIERASELMPHEYNPQPAHSEPGPLRAQHPNAVTVLNNTLVYVQHLQHRLRLVGAHDLVVASTDEGNTPLPPPPGSVSSAGAENGEKDKPTDHHSATGLTAPSTQDILKTLTQAAVNVQRRGILPKTSKVNTQALLKGLTDALKPQFDSHSHFQIQTPHSDAMSKTS